MNTAKALIDVFLGTITLRAGEESVVFKVMNSKGPSDRVQVVSLVGEFEKDERYEEKVMSDPSLEKVIGLKCGDPPDRRVEELEARMVHLESKLEILSKAQFGERFRYEESRFKPPDEELRGYERDKGVWVDSGNKYNGATARDCVFGGELHLDDPR